MNQARDEHIAVAIIGGGPAGLTAAAELAPRTDGEVRVIEREADPDGAYTTGQLQNLVHLHHAQAGRHAAIIGAELVSWSAVLTLREAGCDTVLMTTQYPAGESYAAVRAAGRLALHVPVTARTRVT